MAGLQRSAQTFRRSGSSGLVWDERFLTEGAAAAAAAEDAGSAMGLGRPQPVLRHSRSVGSVSMLRRGRGEAERDDKKRTLAKPKQHKDEQKKQEEEVLVVPGWKAFRTRDVAPAAEPPSPRVPGCCAPCAIFRGSGGAGSDSSLPRRATKPRKR